MNYSNNKVLKNDPLLEQIKIVLGDNQLTTEDFNNHKFNNSLYLRFKLPKTFLNTINPNNETITSLNNYCQIIVRTKQNIQTFKINLWFAIIRLIMNLLTVFLNILLLIFKNQIDATNFLIGIFCIWIFTLIIYFICTKLTFNFYWMKKNIAFNNYKIHHEYLLCKFALISGKETEKNNDLTRVRELFNADLYKFIDEDKFVFLNKKYKNKNYSKFTKWFLIEGCIIIDILFQIIPVILIFLTYLYLSDYFG